MNRSTGIGRAFRDDRETGRALVLRALVRAHAHIDRTAALLGLKRRQVYRLIWREALWAEVDRIRATPPALTNNLVTAARSALWSEHGVQASRTRAARPALPTGGGDANHARPAGGRDERGGGGDDGRRALDVQAVVQGAARARSGGRGR